MRFTTYNTHLKSNTVERFYFHACIYGAALPQTSFCEADNFIRSTGKPKILSLVCMHVLFYE